MRHANVDYARLFYAMLGYAMLRYTTLSYHILSYSWVALLVLQDYLSNTASFVLCVFRRVKDHLNLLYYSPRLKNTCVRQVAVDKWFPLISDKIANGTLQPLQSYVPGTPDHSTASSS